MLRCGRLFSLVWSLILSREGRSAAIAGQRHRLVAVAGTPDAVGEAVLLTRPNSGPKQLAGGARRDLLDRRAPPRGKIGIVGTALDIDRIDPGADIGRGRSGNAEI